MGARSETVDVSGAGSNVETVNPTLGQSVTARPIVNLPLNGRNVLTLALLQPGVTEDNPDDASAGSASLGGGNFSVAGGRSDSITYLLDGGINNELLARQWSGLQSQSGFGGGVSYLDQQLHGGVRPQRVGSDQRRNQVGHQRDSRQCV